MTKRNTKRSLLLSVLALLVCASMLVGTTFAWFTDSVTSAGNIIKSGTLDVEMYWAEGSDDPSNATWTDASASPIFDYDLWEPGYTEVRHINIKNVGTLAFKYFLDIEANGEVSNLSDVIDVYFVDPAIKVDERTVLTDAYKLGTLTKVLETLNTSTASTLLAGNEATVTIALKMQETAGNEYQNKSIGSNFSVKLYATQLTYEEDSFDDQYDKEAPVGIHVANEEELKTAISNEETNIVLVNNITLTEPFDIPQDTTINGNGNVITRMDGTTFAMRSTPVINTGVMFNVEEGKELILENVIVDGGAIWTGEINETLQRGTVNEGITAEGAIINVGKNATVILGEGAVLQNNYGANAVNLGTRTGGKLIINGGEIINNYSAAGAIWGGGEIVMNSGKISYNHGGIGGAIRVVTNIGTVLTMNGGEMNHNYSDGNGGAIWAGSSRSNNVYVLNGGEMAYNYSATTGGAIYAGYYETVKIGGDFKMHDNDCAADIGSAIRFHDHASLVMTGGEVYNNGGDKGNDLYLNNNSASITGGKIVDNFGYSGGLGLTWGMAEVDGVINYNLQTNHNTAYLAKDFGTLKFAVNESASNFAQFNFKPAADYVYTDGDEAKLICMNEGYETYWDNTTSTFRLQAK